MAPVRKDKAQKVKRALGKALPARLAGLAPGSGTLRWYIKAPA
jgi:hypothetical protein